jgi:hypothetical protein
VARRERKNEQASETVFAVFADRSASNGHVQRASPTASLEPVIHGSESVGQLHDNQEEEKEEDDGRYICRLDGGAKRVERRFIHHDQEEKVEEERHGRRFAIGGDERHGRLQHNHQEKEVEEVGHRDGRISAGGELGQRR